MPPHARLGAIPRAPGRAIGLALSEGLIVPSVPSFVPSMFPLQHNELLEFPVFRTSSLAYRNALVTRLYSFSNRLGTLGTSGTELEGKKLRGGDTWNRRGTLGTNLGDCYCKLRHGKREHFSELEERRLDVSVRATAPCSCAWVSDEVEGWTNRPKDQRLNAAGAGRKLKNWWPNTKGAAWAARPSANRKA